MPSEELLPQLRGIAVSKPKRESWMVEELLDALAAADLESRVEATRFRSVYLLYSRADSKRVAESIGYYKVHSAQRIVLASSTLAAESGAEVLSAVAELLARAGAERVRLLVRLRGEGAGLVSERELREFLAGAGVAVDPASRVVLAVESVDRLFLLAIGTTRVCGFRCSLLTPLV